MTAIKENKLIIVLITGYCLVMALYINKVTTDINAAMWRLGCMSGGATSSQCVISQKMKNVLR